jgi:hypothetical protein
MSVPTAAAPLPNVSQGGSEMNTSPIPEQMTANEQAQLLHFTEVGLQWAVGKIDFDAVKRLLGQPEQSWRFESNGEIGYAYFPGQTMTVQFIFDGNRLENGKPVAANFRLKVSSRLTVRIRKEDYEAQFGLHRLIRGESIDGVRTEQRTFFNPTGIIAVRNPDWVTFGYRSPLPADSVFDVYAGFDYIGKFLHDGPEFKSLQNPEDLRAVTVTRRYLTAEELDQRRAARRQKYGMMDLRTGMICPETAVWEGWTENGPTDRTLVWAGEAFSRARNVPIEKQLPFDWVPARWMWLRENPKAPWSET